MSNFASLTYETLIAYILPAAVVEAVFLPLFKVWFTYHYYALLRGYRILAFIGLSLVLGVLFDMWGHRVETLYKQPKMRDYLFGSKHSELKDHLDKWFPLEDDARRVEIVRAIFVSHVSEHVYARRNWDWAFHETSRNMLCCSPLFILGLVLLGIQKSWPVSLWIAVFVSVVAVLPLLWWYAKWSWEKYYDYYANVVLGYLCTQQLTPSTDPSTKQAGEPVFSDGE